jgi:hypothetical protein
MFRKSVVLTLAFLAIAAGGAVGARRLFFRPPPQVLTTYQEPGDGLDEFVGRVKAIQVDTEVYEYTGDYIGQTGVRQHFMTCRFDAGGRKVESFNYRNDGVPLPKTTYSYGEGGLLAREDHFSAVSGRPYLETIYTYDSSGRVKEEIGRNLEDGTVLSRRVYTHDEKRGYTEITKYDWNNTPREKVGIVWDGEGRASELVGFSPWCDGCRVKLTYDEKGRVSETAMSRPGAPGVEKERYAYEDDARGNWVKKTHHRRVTGEGTPSDKLMDITYRALTYY